MTDYFQDDLDQMAAAKEHIDHPTHDAAANLLQQISAQKQALKEILANVTPCDMWLGVWRKSLDERKPAENEDSEAWRHEDRGYWCLYELIAWAQKYAKEAL